MVTISDEFIRRLKNRDGQAWYNLWEVFGANIERMIATFGHHLFTEETVRDISQETLSRVYQEISSYDVNHGVKFSTWVFTITKHIVYSELRHRNAQKRNAGIKPVQLDEDIPLAGPFEQPPEEFEKAIFRSKVYHAIKLVEKDCDFLEFEVYRLKISDMLKSNQIAQMVGISESSVSRYLKKVRRHLANTLASVVSEYSWTKSEESEIEKYSLNTGGDAFDGAVADIYAAEEASRKQYDLLTKTAKKVV
ncbi:RNA polymerase sigma factor [Planctomycetota bacterium]